MRYLTLDSVRALLALYVLCCHFLPQVYDSQTDPGIASVFLYGRTGVTVFIVLSGFSLALASERRKQPYWQFIKRRWRRIAPGYYGTISVTFALRWLHFKSIGIDLVIPLQGLLSNVLFMTDFDVQSNDWFSQTFWSMAVEVKLYFFFPLLLWLYHRYGSLVLLATASAIALAWSLPAVVIPSLPFERIAAWFVLPFSCGIIAAQSLDKKIKIQPYFLCSVTIFCLLIVYGRWTTEVLFYNYYAVLCPTDLAMGVMAACLCRWLAQQEREDSLPIYAQWLRWDLLVWVGGWSYSLYLLHHPLSLHLARILKIWGVTGWSAIALETLPILFLCWLFSQVFEQPFLRRKIEPQ